MKNVCLRPSLKVHLSLIKLWTVDLPFLRASTLGTFCCNFFQGSFSQPVAQECLSHGLGRHPCVSYGSCVGRQVLYH